MAHISQSSMMHRCQEDTHYSNSQSMQIQSGMLDTRTYPNTSSIDHSIDCISQMHQHSISKHRMSHMCPRIAGSHSHSLCKYQSQRMSDKGIHNLHMKECLCQQLSQCMSSMCPMDRTSDNSGRMCASRSQGHTWCSGMRKCTTCMGTHSGSRHWYHCSRGMGMMSYNHRMHSTISPTNSQGSKSDIGRQIGRMSDTQTCRVSNCQC